MEMENKNGENTEELMEQEAQQPETAQEDAAEETAQAAEETTEETEEAPAAETEEETLQEPEKASVLQQKTAGLKKGLKAFWQKVNPLVDVPEEEEEEAAPDEVQEAEAPEEPEEPEAEPVQEAPVRRKPSDAFIIDFPVEEPAQQEAPEQAEAAEETAENAEPAESLEELFAQEEAAEPAPAKKQIKPFLMGLILGGCVVVVGLLVFFGLKLGGVDVNIRKEGVLTKASYTASHDNLSKKAGTVVATMGDKELTMGELQLYYINSIYAFYSQNYYYLSMMGLDLNQPLDQQYYMGAEDMTWEQFFLNSALEAWQNYTVVELLAEEDNFSIDPQLQAQIDAMPEQLESIAAAYGYESAQDYLDKEMAPGVTMDMYVNFNRVYCVCNEYVSHFYANQYPNNKDITLYYKENQELFDSNGITRDMGLISSVRHILIQPKGGTTDEGGSVTYSEEEWASALSEAEQILQQWKEGEATEDSFAVLANTYSEDGGSNTTGGLYEDIHIDASYVPEFKNWAIAFTRKPGDTEIVRTTYGYHIMYFVSGENYFEQLVGEQLVADMIQRELLEVKAEYPMEVNYRKILLCEGSIA
jgi:hypothetical protein